MNNRYTITEAANALNVHAHTLRYWEEELQLNIPRNELGHRVYYQKQIDLFSTIKRLKEQGYQLNAIRMQIMAGMGEEEMSSCELQKVEDNAALKEEKMEKFQVLMKEVVRQAILENREEIGEQITVKLMKEMNYLARESQQQEEERYRKLDELIRERLGKNRKVKGLVFGQKEVARKLKEELRSNKKEAITKCDKVIT